MRISMRKPRGCGRPGKAARRVLPAAHVSGERIKLYSCYIYFPSPFLITLMCTRVGKSLCQRQILHSLAIQNVHWIPPPTVDERNAHVAIGSTKNALNDLIFSCVNQQ